MKFFLHRKEPTFHQFPHFPPEIQILIWELALPGPRTIELKLGVHADLRTRIRQSRHAFQYCTGITAIDITKANARCLAMLHACRAARNIALKHYQPRFGALLEGRPVYFNSEIDILWLSGTLIQSLNNKDLQKLAWWSKAIQHSHGSARRRYRPNFHNKCSWRYLIQDLPHIRNIAINASSLADRKRPSFINFAILCAAFYEYGSGGLRNILIVIDESPRVMRRVSLQAHRYGHLDRDYILRQTMCYLDNGSSWPWYHGPIHGYWKQLGRPMPKLVLEADMRVRML